MKLLENLLPSLWKPPNQGLRHKLLRSHLGVAAVGLAILPIALLSTVWLRSRVVSMAEIDAPLMEAIHQLRAGSQRSLAALRGWVTLGDPRFPLERRQAWEQEIYPGLDRMIELYGRLDATQQREEMSELSLLLHELEESQWWVEDIAQTPGNRPFEVALGFHIVPIGDSIFDAVTAMIDEEKHLGASPERKRTLAVLADFRGSFMMCRASLTEFGATGSLARKRQFEETLSLAWDRLDQLVSLRRHLNSPQRDALDVVALELRPFETYSRSSVEQKLLGEANIAHGWMTRETIPLSSRVAVTLDNIAAREAARITADAGAAARLGNFAFVVFMLLTGAMVAVAWKVSVINATRISKPLLTLAAATAKLAQGNLKDDVPVTGYGELAQLTAAFNRMRNSLLRAEETEARSKKEIAHARDKALTASRMKSEFLANMSHELRTPMNGVLGMAELLRGTELTPEQHEYAEIIHESGQNLLTVINDILDFSKIEAGKLAIEEIPFDLRSGVDAVARLLTPRAAGKGFEVIVRYDPQAPVRLVGDGGRIRQVLMNLGGNAVKFTDRGYVLIDVRYEGVRDGKAQLRFQVQDTGIGIQPDKAAHIFEQFTQADASTTRLFGGTGLGLTISRRLVELMGGSIGMDSRPGEGSTFWFTLPLAVAPETVEPGFERLALVGLRVLVVDDNAVNRRVIEEQLRRCGTECDTAASGEEALRSLQNALEEGKPYALALIDHHMPGMNGEDLARAIQDAGRLRKAPILILLSSLSDLGDRNALRRLGFVASVVKPIDAGELIETIARACAPHHRESAPAARHSSPPQPARSPGRQPAPTVSRGKILVAEDNIVNQKVVSRMLESLGYECDIAIDGRKATVMFKTGSYDLVLMDCHMPEMDGFEATGAIRRLPGSRKPIVALTASALKEDRRRCTAAGMDDFLAKPVSRDALARVLERWIRSPNAPQPAPAEQIRDG